MNFFSQEMNKFIRHTFVPFTMEIIVFLNVNKNVKNDCYSAELIFFAVKKKIIHVGIVFIAVATYRF